MFFVNYLLIFYYCLVVPLLVLSYVRNRFYPLNVSGRSLWLISVSILTLPIILLPEYVRKYNLPCYLHQISHALYFSFSANSMLLYLYRYMRILQFYNNIFLELDNLLKPINNNIGSSNNRRIKYSEEQIALFWFVMLVPYVIMAYFLAHERMGSLGCLKESQFETIIMRVCMTAFSYTFVAYTLYNLIKVSKIDKSYIKEEFIYGFYICAPTSLFLYIIAFYEPLYIWFLNIGIDPLYIWGFIPSLITYLILIVHPLVLSFKKYKRTNCIDNIFTDKNKTAEFFTQCGGIHSTEHALFLKKIYDINGSIANIKINEANIDQYANVIDIFITKENQTFLINIDQKTYNEIHHFYSQKNYLELARVFKLCIHQVDEMLGFIIQDIHHVSKKRVSIDLSINSFRTSVESEYSSSPTKYQ